MRPTEGAGGECGARRAAEEEQRTAIIPLRPRAGNYGACVGCGIAITPSATTLRCRTCAAWARWFSAHRIASAALQEAQR